MVTVKLTYHPTFDIIVHDDFKLTFPRDSLIQRTGSIRCIYIKCAFALVDSRYEYISCPILPLLFLFATGFLS